MLKVLIADDEQIICQMICKLINWKEKGLNIIATVYNGLEAVKIMEEQQPDIIISDIRMPGYDGLQIVQKGKQMGLNADYIIMSGYKNFEYAHSALNLGVKHYLLKPIDKKELEETIDRILHQRKECESINEEKKEIEQITITGKKKIREHFLSTILHSDNLENNKNLEFDEFENGCFLAFLVKVDADTPNQDVKSLLNGINYLIGKTMESDSWEYISSYVKSGVVTVVNYQSENHDKVWETVERIHSLCQFELDKFTGLYLTIGVGEEKKSISQLKESISEAISAVKCRLKKGINRIIVYHELNYRTTEVNAILTNENKALFEKEIECLDINAFAEDFNKIIKVSHHMLNYSPLVIFEVLDEIKKFTCQIWRQNKVQESIIEDFNNQILNIFDCSFREEQLIHNFIEAYQCYFEKVIDDKKNTSQFPIRKAKAYINENYKKQITLDEVAEAVELSPAYLSTLFKKEAGINFSEYIISCRIDASKELLKNGNLPVNLIAEDVGYLDPKYFSKTFYKLVGLKPTEYRKLYR